MPADLSNPFGPACCDGGETSHNDRSARSCGCDPGANWTCERHRIEQGLENRLKEYEENAVTRFREPEAIDVAKVRAYVNPLEEHLHEVINVSWNYAGRIESWQDHVMNATLGLAGEAGEVADLTKKMFYHTEKDRYEELVNELGDVCFYLAKVMELHGITLEECLAANKAKLMDRHKDMFSNSKKK